MIGDTSTPSERRVHVFGTAPARPPVVIKGVYAQQETAVVVNRFAGSDLVQIQCGTPSVTLDAAGHHALLQALAFPPAQEPGPGYCGAIIPPANTSRT